MIGELRSARGLLLLLLGAVLAGLLLDPTSEAYN
jgi:hypothetical protein